MWLPARVKYKRSLMTGRTQKQYNVIGLLTVIFITVLVWFRATGVLYTSDDYQYLHHFAPMSSIVDALKQFVTTDPNSLYWRPLASALAVVDFLNWGWDGRGFHITNFIIHLLTTISVFFVAKKLFKLPEVQALLVTLLFGVAASHEANLLWAAGRTDSLATLFLLCALLFEYLAIHQTQKRWLYRVAGLICCLFSLLSKEIGIFILPLLFFLPSDQSTLRKRLSVLIPYLVAVIVFFLFWSHFTSGLSNSGPMSVSMIHKPSVIAMNTLYTFGYTLIPLDFSQALSLLNEHYVLLIVLISIVTLALFGVLVFLRKAVDWNKYLFPFAFTIFTGSLTMLSFERWRVYMFSVGLFAIVVMLIFDLENSVKSKILRAIPFLLFGVLLIFHITRTVSAENDWLRSTAMLQELKTNLSHILAEHPQRPIKLLFLNRPSKLGGAPLLQLSINDVLSQAELEQTHSEKLATGGLFDTLIDSETPLFVLSLDTKKEFSAMEIKQISKNIFEFSSSDNSSLRFIPAIENSNNLASRDQMFSIGDTLRSVYADVILLEVQRSVVTKARVIIYDTTMLPLLFNGKQFVVVQ